MWICPVCNNKIGNGFCCTSCHFDMSCNYEEYATLTSIDGSGSKPKKSIHEYKKHYEQKKNPDLFACDECGGIYFLFSKAHGELICADCGNKISTLAMHLERVFEKEKENRKISVQSQDFSAKLKSVSVQPKRTYARIEYMGGDPYVIAFDCDMYTLQSQDPIFQQGLKQYTTSDFEDAYQSFEAAAASGNIFAYAHLGIMLHYGEGCSQSDELAFKEFLEGAKAGCPLAASWLAECYRMGYGVEEDKEHGKELLAKNMDALKEMCETEDVAALYFLGFNLIMGIGVDEDEVEGVHLLKIATSKGDKSSAVQLAQCYLNGWGIDADAKKAVRLLLNYPLERSKKYHFLLALCYFEGNGIEKDLKKAFEGFKKAAELGHGQAKDYLGDCYYYGYGVSADYYKAAKWYKDAADNHSNEDSAYSLACMYSNGEGVTRDTQAAIKYFQFAAEKGNIPAQKIISREYIAGASLPRDYNKAKYWMELAAGKGDAEAQFLLGRYYNSGLGFDDKNESFRWFSAAANQGSAEAEYVVGLYYQRGFGTERNQGLANKWFQSALKHGCMSAAYELGINYLNGWGTEIDTEEGIRLLKMAADSEIQENAESKEACRELASRYYYGIRNFHGAETYVNLLEAKKYAAAAAENEKDGEAQFLMADMLMHNPDEGPGDMEEAIEWYRKAAGNRHLRAMLELSELYMIRNRNKSDTIDMLTELVQQNNAKAQYLYALCLEKGFGCKKDKKAAKDYFLLAEKNGFKAAPNQKKWYFGFF